MNRIERDKLAVSICDMLRRYRLGWSTRGGHWFDGSDRWFRPMDLGGRDGSPHSAILARLVKKGHVERRKRNTLANMLRGGGRGSWEYRYVVRLSEESQKVSQNSEVGSFLDGVEVSMKKCEDPNHNGDEGGVPNDRGCGNVQCWKHGTGDAL
jgi:hypothetical protein